MRPPNLLLVVLLPLAVAASFNFFLGHEEVLTLLGLNAELFYVTEGVVNTYALNFVVKIPAHISDIHFTWQSLKSKPLPYTLNVNYDGQGVLLPPQMNITSTGVIPTSLETFWIRLSCTGTRSAQIEVQIQLNVTTSLRPHRLTSLNFRRNKICLRGTGKTLRGAFDGGSLDRTPGSVYIGIASAIAMIGVMLTTASTICIRNKKIRSQEPEYMSPRNNQVFVRLGSIGDRESTGTSGSYATIASLNGGVNKPPPSPYATGHADVNFHSASSQESDDVVERLRPLAVPASTITLQKLAQEGAYGQVYVAQFKGHSTVMVKTVTETATSHQISAFLSEGSSLLGAVHKNVLPILAVNSEDPKRPLLVYPYANKENLKRFLLRCRQREGAVPSLSTQNLVDMAIQILLGAMYLNSQAIDYTDLATRNCVLDENLQVRIADGCLARDLFPDDYASFGLHESQPVKWLAIETLRSKRYNSESQVWSFGVVLWELATLAQQPYPNLRNEEVRQYLERGYRLLQPVGCPDELYACMACCWLENQADRPSSAQILAYLQDFYTALGRFI